VLEVLSPFEKGGLRRIFYHPSRPLHEASVLPYGKSGQQVGHKSTGGMLDGVEREGWEEVCQDITDSSTGSE